MPMADAEIKQTLAAMLGKAHKRKNTVLCWFATGGLLLSVAACGETMVVLTDDMDWSDAAAFTVALVVSIVIFGFIMYIDDVLNARRAQRLADKFNETFGNDKADRQKAIALLHAAKTEQKVEQDLLKALGITSDVEFQTSEQAGMVKVVKTSMPVGMGGAATQSKGGLLGDFKPGDTTSDSSGSAGGQASPDFVPLDPYAAPDSDGGNETKH